MTSNIKPSNVIKFNSVDGRLEKPTLLLKTRTGQFITVLPFLNLNVSLVGKGLDEISFEVHKNKNGKEFQYWDKLIDLCIIDYVGYGQFEAHVTINDEEETIKTLTCKSLECELGQRYLRDFHVNDDDAIEYSNETPFIPTTLYKEDDPDHSLLHRVLYDKGKHWSIGFVSSRFNVGGYVYRPQELQRTFTADNTTIYDFLDGDVSKELGCVFTYDTYNRKINCYNLEECVYKKSTLEVMKHYTYKLGVFYDENGVEVENQNEYGYCDGLGEDTNVYVSKAKLSRSFSMDSDEGSVKNCFYVVGGDDLITNTVAAANVVGNNYIYLFANFQYEDMGKELSDAIASYSKMISDKTDEFYKDGGVYLYNKAARYNPEDDTCVDIATGRILTTSIIDANNKVYTINKYSYHTDNGVYDEDDNLLGTSDYVDGSYIYLDDAGLYTKYTQAVARLSYLESGKFPNIPSRETNARQEFLRMLKFFGSNNIYVSSSYSPNNFAHVTATFEKVLQSILDVRYEYKLADVHMIGYYLDFEITISRITDKTDTTTELMGVKTVSNTTGDIEDTIAYCEQKMRIAISSLDLMDLDFQDKTKEQLKELLMQYNLNSLKSFRDGFESCRSTLSDLLGNNGIEESLVSDSHILSREMYNDRVEVAKECYAIREEQVNKQRELVDKLAEEIVKFRESLDMYTYFHNIDETDTLWKQFQSYIREDEYNNSNYISDGLSDSELLENAKELLIVAKEELEKACTIQYKVSGELSNIFALKELSALHDKFALYNYIRANVDGKVYKLRLTDISFSDTSPESLNVTFSETITDVNGFMDTAKKILEQSASIATTYSYTEKQAKQGAAASDTFDSFREEGLNSAMYIIKNSNDESVVIDESGILCRSMNDPMRYDPHQLRIVSNGMYMTDNAWNSVKTAIGRFKYEDDYVYGVNAEVLAGNVLIGNELSIKCEDQRMTIDNDGLKMTNASETSGVLIDTNGEYMFRLYSDGKDLLSVKKDGTYGLDDSMVVIGADTQVDGSFWARDIVADMSFTSRDYNDTIPLGEYVPDDKPIDGIKMETYRSDNADYRLKCYGYSGDYYDDKYYLTYYAQTEIENGKLSMVHRYKNADNNHISRIQYLFDSGISYSIDTYNQDDKRIAFDIFLGGASEIDNEYSPDEYAMIVETTNYNYNTGNRLNIQTKLNWFGGFSININEANAVNSYYDIFDEKYYINLDGAYVQNLHVDKEFLSKGTVTLASVSCPVGNTETGYATIPKKDGYIPIATTGFRITNVSGGSGAGNVLMRNYDMYTRNGEETIRYSLRNIGSAATTASVYFYVIYMRI